MQNRRSTIVFAIAWTLFWALMVSVAIQDYIKNEDGEHLWKPVLWETSSMVAVSVLLALQLRLTRGHGRRIATPGRWFAWQACWLPFYWIGFVPLAFGIRHGAYQLAGLQYEHRPWPETFFYEDLKITIFFSLFVLIRFGMLSFYELLEEKLRVEKANALLREAQLQRLAQQMQPHFLFNALNTISSLMHTDVDKADATLVQLAEVLRTTLAVSEQHAAPLATELRLVRGYAAVMEERYAERVRIAWNVDETAMDCMVPVMSIQPLLENIFKHTVEQRRTPTSIAVTIARTEGQLHVVLDDDSGMLSPSHGVASGIGMKNLRERLAVMYGEQASLTLAQLHPAGVRAEMRLPCAC
jgi:two-component system, LytTR family, sensor kinase